jgi:hypothetical protein
MDGNVLEAHLGRFSRFETKPYTVLGLLFIEVLIVLDFIIV